MAKLTKTLEIQGWTDILALAELDSDPADSFMIQAISGDNYNAVFCESDTAPEQEDHNGFTLPLGMGIEYKKTSGYTLYGRSRTGMPITLAIQALG